MKYAGTIFMGLKIFLAFYYISGSCKVFTTPIFIGTFVSRF